MTTTHKPKAALALAASLITVVLLLLAACSSERPSPTSPPTVAAAPTATPTAAPSPTAVPTQTPASAPTPTQAPAITSTPAPTPTQAPAITATPVPIPSTPAPTREPSPAGPVAPELVDTQEWVNSDPLKIEELRGRVVLIDFWTYTCVNCIRTLPYLKVWHSKYSDDGLVIIGVHTPEFKFEHEIDNVRQAISDYSVTWPVVQDNNFSTWDAFDNRYWPAKYLIDQNGVIRYQHFGEGAYAETEAMIRELIEETGVNLSAVAPLAAP